jgi:hypothetical protein
VFSLFSEFEGVESAFRDRMRVFKHWYQEKYDDKQTIIEFMAYHFAEMKSAPCIIEMVRKAHPDFEIDEEYEKDEVLKDLLGEYI